MRRATPTELEDAALSPRPGHSGTSIELRVPIPGTD
jgi:hypothetical protein